jgi:MoxR-like ATPase
MDVTMETQGQGPADAVEAGAYELLRARLQEQSGELYDKARRLNEQREAAFGASALGIIGSALIRTENNCVPRDIVQVSGVLVFGYNVFIGLKTETRVADVFGLYRLQRDGDDFQLQDLPLAGSFLDDAQFRRDFAELYKYYRESALTHLRVLKGKLLAVFRTGRSTGDSKVFRWAIGRDGEVRYLDNRGERDNSFPATHDFEWLATGRDQFVSGAHPHVSIDDEIFVDAIGGNLTVKVENNTADGLGIYQEPVEHADQGLADAEWWYARVGSLILVKVRPYREDSWRYLVYDSRNRRVTRIDRIGQACLQLPEDHGIIFPGGYYLLSGGHKSFDADVRDLLVKRVIRSPNGEDVLYVFHHLEEGRMMLLSYNLISKDLQNPISCHGYSLHDDGLMVLFRYDSDEATRIHPMQIWQTPYCSDEYLAAAPASGGFLGTIGNANLVRAISDAYSIQRLIREATPSLAVYEDLIRAVARMLDAYHWLGEAEAGDLQASLKQIQASAELVLAEFEKVAGLRAGAAQALQQAEQEQRQLIAAIRPDHWRQLDEFVASLNGLRQQRGHLITLRELRYVEQGQIDRLEQEAVESYQLVSRHTVDFLLGEDALKPYFEAIDEQSTRIDEAVKRIDLTPVEASLAQIGADLDLLNEIIATLRIDDATQRTGIIERIAEVYGRLNRARATLANRFQSLGSAEASAEFAAQFRLFDQSLASALAQADTLEAADQQLTRSLVLLEELEGRFSEFDQYLAELAGKREEVYQAFESRKQRLQEERQRQAHNLAEAARRILEGVARRAAGFGDADSLNSYFASDPMLLKLRDLIARLRAIGDSVRADDLEGQVKAARDQATRNLRDRNDIFEGDGQVIRLGQHRFSVNLQSLDLTLLADDETLRLHLTGTDYQEPLADERLQSFRDYWSRTLPSESPTVYRGEYLAASLLDAATTGAWQSTPARLLELRQDPDALLQEVRRFAAPRFEEGYERGVHDVDATSILADLLELRQQAGLLRYAPLARCWAALFWSQQGQTEQARHWLREALSLGRMRHAFPQTPQPARLAEELSQAIEAFAGDQQQPLAASHLRDAGQYLSRQLASSPLAFVTRTAARELLAAFLRHLEQGGKRAELELDMRELADFPGRRLRLAMNWLQAYGTWRQQQGEPLADAALTLEAAGILAAGDALPRAFSQAETGRLVSGLLGAHPRIREQTLQLDIAEFLSRLASFQSTEVPAFQDWRQARQQLLAQRRQALRLDELRPRPLTTFVRNRLIDEVYLPIIGDNLAKQMGALGDRKRTDLMGLLLLISPPGYGKTTLMEYLASRLGLVFMKINCPAIGHKTLSLDPGAAPDATARQELEKLNLGLEMGNNVMLYLDDIQHANPEFLQKFISLGDAQRKIEGVWRGHTRTYDLRGKKVCVVMAGNPYTESGAAFKIPDMLANRADIYNLGDVLSGREAVFAMSYLENALTSNQALAPLANRDMQDVYRFVRLARGEEVANSEFAHDYAAGERREIVAVLQRMLRVREVVMAVNRQYIASAAQDDAYREEPPFKLQGSYRNMNKMAEKLVAVMNERELEELIDDHYRGEAQTLTSGAEENLLKLAELRGNMSAAQRQRWQAIRAGYRRILEQGDQADDPANRLVRQLTGISQHLGDLRQQVERHLQQEVPGQQRQLLASVSQFREAMERMEMNVQVVNQPVPGMQLLLTQLTRAYDDTLLPLLKSLHHKLSLDESIWRNVRESAEILKKLDQHLLEEGNRKTVRAALFQPGKPKPD